MELKGFTTDEVERFISQVFHEDMHQKRLLSLANATLGCMETASLAVHTMGYGLSLWKRLNLKHAIKQIDRLLSNAKLDVWSYFESWVIYMLGERKAIVVSLDWTDFGKDEQSTITLHLQTNHGRSLPLMWLTIPMSEIKAKKKNDYEDKLLAYFREIIPTKVQVTVVADRGFCDTNLLGFLEQLGFGYVVRIYENIWIEDAEGRCKKARDWVPMNGKPKTLRDVKITGKGHAVATVVCVREGKMKQSWCLVSSHGDLSAREIKQYYGQRWGIESTFRDIKDYRFGMGMDALRIRRCDRRDRLLLISALTLVLLTLLGAAGESLGMDKRFKVNTVKTRTHSLFRQGCMLFGMLHRLSDEELLPLLQRFYELMEKQRCFQQLFFVV